MIDSAILCSNVHLIRQCNSLSTLIYIYVCIFVLVNVSDHSVHQYSHSRESSKPYSVPQTRQNDQHVTGQTIFLHVAAT